ncbi:MAG TPA: YfhO family protein [Pyrinomonadaceae bacterium]|nr:YfhO family protein [Pyrinomonadaceae bacterium]
MISLIAKIRTPWRVCGFVLLFYVLLFTVFFSPVLLRGFLLAPGDGFTYHLPFFRTKTVLWDNLIGSGFPATADPQVMAWYPPAMILSAFPGTWNLFVVSAYVLASCFAFGYVYALTKSKVAGLVSGITYGMCGFMVAHLGHTAIIHVAPWPPLVIWVLHTLREKFSARWLALGSLGIACCILAGHFQIVLYGIVVALCYAMVMGWTAPIGRGRYYAACAGMFLLGLGLTAIQVLPTAQLAQLSTRSDFQFLNFVSYSLPYKNLPLFFYPAAMGGLPRYGGTPYFGDWNLIEMTGYVGLLPLMLAAAGFVRNRRHAVGIFWACLIGLALILALGERTPLAFLIFKLPIVSQFRAPARHLFEISLALSVLAGLGVQAIVKREVSRRLVVLIAAATGAMMAVSLLLLSSARVRQLATERGGTNLNLRPWANPAIGIPILVFLAAATVLFLWQARPDSFARRILLISILIVDLASFGWFFSWRFSSPAQSILSEPTVAAEYGKLLREQQQRMAAVRGSEGQPSELPPNATKLWNIPSATIYSPLSLSRMSSLLSMRPDGSLDPSWKELNNQSLNLAATRYVVLPRAATTKDRQGVEWSTEEISLWLAGGCNQPQNKSIKFEFAKPLPATMVGIVSRLACSVSIPDGTEVARVSVTGPDGRNEVQSLLAGRDTAEWAYDCSTVKPGMKHKPAEIFSSFPAAMNAESCSGHFYVTRLNLSQVREVTRLELVWTGQAEALSIEKITVFDNTSRTSTVIDPVQVYSNHWRRVKETADARVFENVRALPRAWLARETLVLDSEQMLTTIKTSRYADGRFFDPYRTALVEEPVDVGTAATDSPASAQIVQLTDRAMEVQTDSAAAAFLVTSDSYYPGWQVSVDGQPAKLHRANYAFRGVVVPAGKHLVRFEYRPRLFYLGVLLSAASGMVICGFVLVPVFRKRKNANHRD